MRLLPGGVPMWGQMEKTGACCGFIITKLKEPSWRVARHGSYQLNKVKMQMKEKDQSTHLPVYAHLCDTQAIERSFRSRQRRKQRGTEIQAMRVSMG